MDILDSLEKIIGWCLVIIPSILFIGWIIYCIGFIILKILGAISVLIILAMMFFAGITLLK